MSYAPRTQDILKLKNKINRRFDARSLIDDQRQGTSNLKGINSRLSDEKVHKLKDLKHRAELGEIVSKKLNKDKDQVTSDINKLKEVSPQTIANLEKGNKISKEEILQETVDTNRSLSITDNHNLPPKVQWSSLNDLAHHIDKIDGERTKMKQRETQESVRRDLDRQVADRKKRLLKEKEDAVKYFQLQVRQSELDMEKERELNLERQIKMEKEREIQEEAMRIKKEKIENARQEKLNKEKAYLDKVLREITRDKKRIEREVVKEKKLMEKMIIENEAEEEVKRKLKQAEVEEDARLLREYEERLKLQEEKRKAEMDARVARQKNLIAKMADGVVKVQENKSREDEARAEKQRLEGERRRDLMEGLKSKILKEQRAEIKSYLEDQITRHEQEKKAQEIYKKKTAEVLVKDAELARAEQIERAIEKEKKREEYKKELEQQIREKELQRRQKQMYKDCMNETEIMLNKELIGVAMKCVREAETKKRFGSPRLDDDEEDFSQED